MNTQPFSEDDLFQLDSSSGDLAETEVIELEKPETNQSASSGLYCEQCDAPRTSDQMAVCQNCGWYASLGTFVEVDREWEKGTTIRTDGQPMAPRSHLQVWMNLLPWYAWLAIIGVAAMIVESVIIRLTFSESKLYTTWSLAQLAIGFTVFSHCHLLNYIALASDDSDTALLDFILKPLKIWIHAARQLPRKWLFFDSGLVGLAAVIGSLAIIGGIPYDRMLDWGIKERPQTNLLGAVMEQAAKHADDDTDMTMEEAIEALAGNAGVGNLDGDGDDKGQASKPESKHRQKLDCVILGFRADKEGNIMTLILGAAHYGKLRYAGRVEPVLDDEENAELLEQLLAARTHRPFLPLQLSAIWVRPVYACRVSFTGRQKDGRLEEIEWRKMLGEIKFK